MNIEYSILKDHHAYFFSGEKDTLEKSILFHFEKKEKITLLGNPDFLLIKQEVFGIDDARGLKEWQEKKAFGENGKIALVVFSFITTEAQNALLKMFEEPLGESRFFVVAPTSAVLLPTLRSRLVLFSREPSIKNLSEAEGFIRGSVDERMVFAEKYKGTENEENENKKSELLSLCSDIETLLHKRMERGATNQEFRGALEECMKLKKYLLARSPSVKMIAEYLALRLPRFSSAESSGMLK